MNRSTARPSGRARTARAAWAGLAALCLTALVACTSSEPLGFETAAARGADDLAAQTGALPAFLARFEATLTPVDPKAPRRRVVLDPMLETTSGQQTATTALLGKLVGERLGRKTGRFELVPFRGDTLPDAQLLLTGTMTRAPGGAPAAGVRIDLALTDLKTRQVIAQTTVHARDEALDPSPLRYYKDSPIVIKDKVSEGYARTSRTAVGQPADTYYLERIGVAAQIDAATTLYNAERYRDALGRYEDMQNDAGGQQLRIESGIYLTNMRLGRVAEAEQAFGRIVALGIQYNELGVKFLFNPGSLEFWSDPKISGSYGMWLRQIARESVRSNTCMNVVGHTSNSGDATLNDALSLRRAGVIRQLLVAQAPVLGARTAAIGKGFRENLVGSGTDNGFDVLDRRVEFKIVGCEQIPAEGAPDAKPAAATPAKPTTRS
ncbi:OmpA family protein [Piscinibacter koreensis]|uniref:OmpA family protein n=1 Tax=Piscinibacter koreensis TaxID=2742824 RepID=A0A7Y6NJK3_9BURK|nr:OmpA family protein [Schlegelella koreensis]NUZ04378.1 OmpA family protein [Schlegelella koreensis]